MILGVAIGEVVSTLRHASLARRKLLLVRPATPEGKAEGEAFLALDTVGAGAGDRVLVVHEGNAAEAILGIPGAPVRSLIVGVVDAVVLASPGQREAP
jgi:ethanolamine utilization protein EutN